MTETTKDLLKRALELAPAEREHLARELLASLEDADDVKVEPDPAFVRRPSRPGRQGALGYERSW